LYRMFSEGDPSKGHSVFKKSLVQNSNGLPIERGLPRPNSFTLRFWDSEAKRIKRARQRFEYTAMNAYDTHEMTTHCEPTTSYSWYKLSWSGEPRVRPSVPQYMWGVDIPVQNPANTGFSYEPYGYPGASEYSDAAMRKLFRAVQRTKDSGLDAALLIAELGETWNLFASAAARINRSYRALRRGKIRDAFHFLGHTNVRGLTDVPPNQRNAYPKSTAFVSDYLAWQFGVKPLLSDIDAACHKLADVLSNKPAVMRCSGRSSGEIVHQWLNVRPFIAGSQRRCDFQRKEDLRVQHVVWYTVSDAMIAHASALGFTNPMDLAYQVFPVSFVFDWMIGVGEWLKGFSTFHGLQFMQGCTSRSGSQTDTYQYGDFLSEQFNSYNYYDSAGNPASFLYKSDYSYIGPTSLWIKSGGFRRTVWESFPTMPLPEWRFPATEDSALGKLSSSLALLAQRRVGVVNRYDLQTVPKKGGGLIPLAFWKNLR